MAPRILLIRHAEKPDGQDGGVNADGSSDEKSLTVRGWQRAGALIAHFSEASFLFASHSSSSRPRQTLEPLSAKQNLKLNLDFGKGDEQRLVDAAKACGGVVVICWQHEFMAEVANAILGDTTTAPQDWPQDRFDMTWVFDRDGRTGGYTFSQEPQLLLAGDSSELIGS
jgi:Histidine phosphatase superfamily (branch 1)